MSDLLIQEALKLNTKDKMVKKTQTKASKINSTIARSEDGTIQIYFTIPWSVVQSSQNKALEELSKNVSVPGFRKGKAPKEKAAAYINTQQLTEQTLQAILPKAFSEAVKKHKIKPIIYPRFEIIHAHPQEDWQIRATTCEYPKIDLPDYKKEAANLGKREAIWVPGKDQAKQAEEPTREDKEQKVLEMLLAKTKISVPKVLVDEELERRLASLIEKIDKLGLTLEKYLANIGKTPDQLRQEYSKQAQDSIRLEFILDKIAQEEKIEVEEPEVNQALSITGNKEIADNPQSQHQRRLVKTILARRKVVDRLVSLV